MRRWLSDVIGSVEYWLRGVRRSVSCANLPRAADVRAVAPAMPNERLVNLGQVVRVGTTADFVAMIEDQRARVKAVVSSGAISPR